jgi:pimeloyl-ACP methyl ester carboxylesterase
VLLCHPGPQDYRHTHWAFRKLATLLAKEGFHVLRFDYSCTGDSAGESTDANIAQWTEDVTAAARELQDSASLRRVSIVAMRLGAPLAARACSRGLRLDDMVFWEPVVSGKNYLSELERAQELSLLWQRFPENNARSADELLGYPMPSHVRSSISEIDLLTEDLGSPRRLLVVSAREHDSDSLLCQRVRAKGVESVHEVIPDPVLNDGGAPGFILVAHNIPNTIAAYLARRSS